MHSDKINEIASALAKAQGQIKAAKKDGTNPHLKNRYTTLDSIIETVKEPLSVNGLSFSQLLQQGQDGIVLETWLFHESGQYITSEILVSPMSANRGTNEMQALGSSLTYMKRYALGAMLGVSSEDDDDGNAATSSGKQQRRQPAPAPAPKPANGNGKEKVDSPQKLLELVNNRVLVTYDNVSHLFNAIRQESTLDDYTWPSPDDTDGWRSAYKLAKEHADKKTSSKEEAE